MKETQPLTRLARASLGLASTRLELFEVEFQETKFRAIHLFVLLAATIAFAVAGILVLSAVVGVFLFRVGGYGALAGLGGALLLTAIILFWLGKRTLLHGVLPFSESINEFKKDIACLTQSD
ncbi:MAG: phage holin family protein [Opitutaceae bacterium]